MPKLYRLSDPYSIEQYHLIQQVLKQYKDVCIIAYQSNWYIVVACHDWYMASEIRAKLRQIQQWNIDIQPGRKNKVRHYLNIQLLRE